MAFLGHLGPLQPLRPVGQSGPFWPNPLRPKGAKGDSPLPPKARWAPNSMKTPRTHFGQGSPWTTFQPMAYGNHQRPLDKLSNPSPQLKGYFPIPPCIWYSRLQEWCIYGMIYHYAPFLLINSMVTFSVPNSMIPNQGPKIQCPFWRRTLQLISLEIHGGYQKTSQGPQPPGPARVGLEIISGFFQGPFSEVIHHQISFQGSKYFNTPWTTQLVHTGRNQLYLYVLGPIGPIHIPLWELNHTVQFPRCSELY
ncbi:hypothetical protein O181_106821 [Austropuccinia psidii MF-1]|uniref:Uncharacterized protein n=1 Tax=Austropuccinia psidii MF-1 TaxID=1389203 RepID=A0A9Q3JRP1_9BASI|nr:hypothetical protein [Austropuccinia psidii MF-1]